MPDLRLPLGAAVALGALLAGAALHGQEPQPSAQQEDRYLLHLATDRPSYRPGERVHLRGMLLHAFDRHPAPAGAAAGEVLIKSPRGETLTRAVATGEGDGLAVAWDVPAEAAGGLYTAVATPFAGYAPAEVQFEVRSYRLPRLKTELEFVRKAYGPGDEVQATLAVERAEGGAPAGAAVTCLARADGRVVHQQELRLDAGGRLTVRFRLPERIASPDATLALVIKDGGVTETAAKTIPLVLNRLRLTTYPEGGDLVAGLPGRVYFEARTLSDDPADVRGRVLDASGAEVARFSSEHEGRGRFSLTPRAGEQYQLVLDEPAGVSERFALPPVKAAGLGLGAGADVTAADQPLALAVSANPPQRVRLVATVRDRSVGELALEAGQEPRQVELRVPDWVAGAVRVTLFDAQGRPAAERLVFRAAPAGLRVEVSASPERAAPGEPVKLTVRTLDAAGKPRPALVAVSVVDDATLKRVEPRERAPRLPTQVLLGSEVRELRDAQVYLDDPQRGPLATDLLLGTQGWRRFALVRREQFLAEHKELGRRVLAERSQPRPDPRRRARLRGAVMEKADGAVEEDGAWNGPPEAAAPPAPLPAPPQEPEERPAQQAEANAEVQAGEELAQPALEPAEPAAGARAEAKRMARDAEGLAFADELEQERQVAVATLQSVRVFAATGTTGATRSQFLETLYWNAGSWTGADGQLEASFTLNDSITTFRVLVDAVGKDGALAWGQAAVESRRPFYLEAKLPLEVSGGDEVLIPLALVNGSNSPLAARISAGLEGKGAELSRVPAQPIQLGGDARERALLRLKVGDTRGELALTVDGVAESGRATTSDSVRRTVQVVPRGFPIEVTAGGLVGPERALSRTIRLPEGVVPGSLEAEAVLYPTPLASLGEALAALLGEPYGCFEQTSSTNYPNVMAMRYFTSHQGVDPALVRRSAELLKRGYDRLVSFECKEKGYEWFGGDPGHEALSAYGLLEFSDMAAVMPVDAAMVSRTRAWLLSRRDGKGGFKRNERALDSFGAAPPDVTNAYITWALVESGEEGLDPEVEAVLTGALASGDSYVLALAANIARKRGDAARARDLCRKLAQAQTPDGSVAGAATSITRSGGESLLIETTALAALAWLPDPDATEALEKAMRWLVGRCKAGRFGSTQSTVLALRAVIAYDQARAKPKAAGTALVLVNGKVVDELPFAAGEEGALKLPRFVDALRPGENTVEVKMVNGAEMPASLLVRYRAETPVTAPEAGLELTTRLADAELGEGEATELQVRLRNTLDQPRPMVVAVIGFPAGLEVRTAQLEELKRAGACDFVETRGREVILYWRGLAPGASCELNLSAVAAIPGRTTGPASRAYLYYTDEHKVWAPGLAVTIAAPETR